MASINSDLELSLIFLRIREWRQYKRSSATPIAPYCLLFVFLLKSNTLLKSL